MKRYLLDTSICIYFLKGEHQLDKKIAEIGLENCFISEISIAELTYGVENSNPRYKTKNRETLENLKKIFHSRIIPINSCFQIYAEEKVRLRRAGTPIGEFDLLIGCSALAKGLVMITTNTKEFNRLLNLEVENWLS
jgi:tRNA(fMet)-specific endonuclease VapC